MAFIGNTYTTQGFVPAVDFFNGNGSTVAFTLSRPVASVAQVQAVVENVPQKPNDAYTVSGNTITFTSAPPSGTQNIYVYYTSPITQVIAPSQGTVGPTALTAGAPSWSQTGGVTLPRIDSTNEGGQINFNRASDDTQVWAIDSFGSTSTPTLRFINGATVAMALDGSNNVGIGTSTPSVPFQVTTNPSTAAGIMAQCVPTTGTNAASLNFNNSGSGSVYIGRASSAGTGPSNATISAYDTFIWNDGSQNLVFGTSNVERGRFDTSGNFRFNSGYGSVATAYGCRAWVNFNGTGTVAIRASGNVSSITDNGTGDYTVNFTTAMPDVNYSVCGAGGTDGSTAAQARCFQPNTTSPSTTAFRFTMKQGNDGSNADGALQYVAVFR